MKICVDTNVVLALFLNEPDRESARELLKHCLQTRVSILSAEQMKAEFYSVLTNKVHRKLIPHKLALELSENLQELNIQYYSASTQDLTSAMKIAYELNQPTVYDAIFLELAMKTKSCFVTDDKKFLEQAKKLHKKSYSSAEMLGVLINM